MSNMIIRIATRKSPLALWQAEHIASSIKSNWPNIETKLVPMQTKGDQFLKDKLQLIGGKGLFTKELEIALQNYQADIAVHSMKDVPSSQPKGLTIAAICERHNPYDAFVSNRYHNLDELPPNAIVGTSSLRREAQLLANYPNLTIKTLRGNINTRLHKLDNNEYDAIILAASGLMRLKQDSRIKSILDKNVMLPACGQGALGVECRDDDKKIISILESIKHRTTEICVNTERYVNLSLGGSCHAPIGVFCEVVNNKLILSAKVLSKDGKAMIYSCHEGNMSDNMNLAKKILVDLEIQGVKKLIQTSPD
jgi:hydroxymethylbilane synthase